MAIEDEKTNTAEDEYYRRRILQKTNTTEDEYYRRRILQKTRRREDEKTRRREDGKFDGHPDIDTVDPGNDSQR